MRSDSKRVVRASFLSAVLGGLTGFGLGLIVAPDEGDKVRRRIAYLLDSWTGQVATLVDRLRHEDAQSGARQSGADLIADAREQAERILQDANQLMREVRQRPPAP